MIQRYQQAELSLIAKYKYRTYNKVYFRGGSNNNLNLITCEDNIFIPSKFQSCVIHWYHTYIHHPVNRYNGGNDLPTFVLARHHICLPEVCN